jgi:hypothetical protein
VIVSAKTAIHKRRLSYTDADAKLLLACARAEKGARRWVPWLLAFTGARLQEVCQSLVRDIRQEDGVWFLDINADDETKTLKNVGSARKVPLHAALVPADAPQAHARPREEPLRYRRRVRLSAVRRFGRRVSSDTPRPRRAHRG